MFYQFLFPLAEHISFFNLFQYITVRAGGALGTSFLLTLILGSWVIEKLRIKQYGGTTVSKDHPGASATIKAGTPSMGGVMIIGSLLISALLWTDISHPFIWMLVFSTLVFGGIGFADDYLSITRGARKGLSGKLRLLIEAVAVTIIVGGLVYMGREGITHVYLPFFKDVVFDLGVVGFTLFAIFVVVGSANAVNLTDGLDGLVSVPAAVVAFAFAALAYIVGRVDFTDYLHITYVPGASEIAVFCSALAGSMLGFLWFNAPPARVFMGDTGSLAVGGVLGTVAILLKQEFLLAIIGGIFVLETVSVIVQVASFKLTGKRVFRMAPLHHHFEHKGWPESTIVVRFWIISIILALVGLATLKIR